MPSTTDDPLLHAILAAWDRHQTTLLNLLGVIPAADFSARAMPSSPTVGEMFSHMHHERMISLQENTPEWAGTVPDNEWIPEADAARIRAQLEESGDRVRKAVEGRIATGQQFDQDFSHPVQFLLFLVFHESYHHGQIKLALKAAGRPLADDVIGPLIYDVWRSR